MKIAIIFPPTSGRGGMETATVNLVSGLEAADDDVRLFALSESFTDDRWHHHLPWTNLGAARQSKLSLRQAIQLSFLLRAELMSYRPDVIVVLTAFSIPIAKLAMFGMKRIPIVSWLHFTLKMIGRRGFLRLADAHTAISPKGSEELRTYLGNDTRIFTVPNGILPTSKRIQRPGNQEPVHFLYVGRLQIDDQKRVNDILLAASRLTGGFRLTFVGTGDDSDALSRMAADFGLTDRVEWKGWQAEPWSCIPQASVLLLASSFEGFPMVLLEALSRGLPCISSNCETGPSDIIHEGENGWLFPVGNVEALQILMQRVIDDRTVLPSTDQVTASVQPFLLQETTRLFRAALQEACGQPPIGRAIAS